jgi:hypothetical protein
MYLWRNKIRKIICSLCIVYTMMLKTSVNLWAYFYSNNLSQYTYWKLTFSTWNLVSKIPDVKTRHLRISCKYKTSCSVMNLMYLAHFINHEWRQGEHKYVAHNEVEQFYAFMYNFWLPQSWAFRLWIRGLWHMYYVRWKWHLEKCALQGILKLCQRCEFY